MARKVDDFLTELADREAKSDVACLMRYRLLGQDHPDLVAADWFGMLVDHQSHRHPYP
jgi:hypothetical protein